MKAESTPSRASNCINEPRNGATFTSSQVLLAATTTYNSQNFSKLRSYFRSTRQPISIFEAKMEIAQRLGSENVSTSTIRTKID